MCVFVATYLCRVVPFLLFSIKCYIPSEVQNILIPLIERFLFKPRFLKWLKSFEDVLQVFIGWWVGEIIIAMQECGFV